MPLIIVTGYPTAGKTFRSRQLYEDFSRRIQSSDSPITSKLRIHHITDKALGVERSVYNLETKESYERSANASEKDARAAVFGAVKRVLSENDIVILDAAAGSYIKGWRYQLFCEAKAMQTQHCVMHVGTPVDVARVENERRLKQRDDGVRSTRDDEEPYEPSCWENLVFRYEEPNAFNRWDSPLFTVVRDDETPPCDEMWDVLVAKKKGVVRSHQATVIPRASSEGHLHALDRITQEVLKQILEWQKDHPGEGGGVIDIISATPSQAGAEDDEAAGLQLYLPTNPVTVPGLQRLRRQFLTMNRQNPGAISRIRESFVLYLNDTFESM